MMGFGTVICFFIYILGNLFSQVSTSYILFLENNDIVQSIRSIIDQFISC